MSVAQYLSVPLQFPYVLFFPEVEEKRKRTVRDRFPPNPNPTEGSSYEAITKPDVMGGLCQKGLM